MVTLILIWVWVALLSPWNHSVGVPGLLPEHQAHSSRSSETQHQPLSKHSPWQEGMTSLEFWGGPPRTIFVLLGFEKFDFLHSYSNFLEFCSKFWVSFPRCKWSSSKKFSLHTLIILWLWKQGKLWNIVQTCRSKKGANHRRLNGVKTSSLLQIFLNCIPLSQVSVL